MYFFFFTALLADHQQITPHIGEQLVELCSVEPAVLFAVGGPEGSKQNVSWTLGLLGAGTEQFSRGKARGKS